VLAVADREQVGPDERCHRRRWNLAGDDRLEELASGTAGGTGAQLRGVMPGDELAAVD